MACDEKQLKNYKGLNIGPTFVHKNQGHMSHRRELEPGETEHPAGSRTTDMSPSYNKPGSIMYWVQESEEAKHVDYVLYIDADMLLRRPMDPVALGVKPGEVVIENLMMQLESLGLNCSNWNDTGARARAATPLPPPPRRAAARSAGAAAAAGPTTPGDPGCMAVDPKQTWCYCHDAAARGALAADGLLWPPPRDGPGLCTSIVAQDPAGRIVHARNMDWVRPPSHAPHPAPPG